MKKITLILALLLCVGAAGCSSQPEASVPIPPAAEQPEETPSPDPPKEDSVPVSPSPAPEELPAAPPAENPPSAEENLPSQEEESPPAAPLPPANPKPDGSQPISPADYQALLGKGMDVDWSKTKQGRTAYHPQAASDFAAAGVSHVRIRVKDPADEELFQSLDAQIQDCLAQGLIPIVAYQADEFKNQPTEKNIQKVVDWWGAVAQRYQDTSYLLAFDLIIESTDQLNKEPEKLNEIYERLVEEIRKTNPQRIIMISPRLRSDPAYLKELKIPSQHNNYLMAEWHFYAAGPSKDNPKKLWTTGSDAEKQLILDKINTALQWQKETGVPTWVGAWMPGNYNDGNDYSIQEQVGFASFVTQALTEAGIPFAVNSDTKFYDRENRCWIPEMQPVFQSIFGEA